MSNTTSDYFLRVDLENVRAAHSGSISIALPVQADYLRRVLGVLEIANEDELKIQDIRSPRGEYAMARMIEEASAGHSSPPEALMELNYLAVKLAGMTEGERKVFQAALDVKYCDKLAEMINIADNLDKFELQPFQNAEQYGKHLVKQGRAQFADICQRMLFSKNPDEAMFANHYSNLEDSVNYTDYGNLIAEYEVGVFTQHGYMAMPNPHPSTYRGAQDIPSEYRISPGEQLVRGKPSLMETLRLGREKSREQFGIPSQEQDKDKGATSL